jgi:hypothetical protein
MTVNLIPQDRLTRRQIAKVLAQMIREDFEKERAGRTSLATTPVSANDDADLKDRRQLESTPAAANWQVEVKL